MKRYQSIIAVLLLLLVLPSDAFASAAGMPWEAPLDKVTNSMAGPVARSVGVLAILITGLGLAFGEGGGGMKKMLWVVMGLTIAFSSTSFFLDFFGYSQGLSF